MRVSSKIQLEQEVEESWAKLSDWHQSLLVLCGLKGNIEHELETTVCQRSQVRQFMQKNIIISLIME